MSGNRLPLRIPVQVNHRRYRSALTATHATGTGQGRFGQRKGHREGHALFRIPQITGLDGTTAVLPASDTGPSTRNECVAPVNPTPLYRPEVLEARRNRWLGRLILRQPISHWAMTWVAIGTAALTITFVCTGEYARKVRIEGRLVDAIRGDSPSSTPRDERGDATLEAQLAVPEDLLASTTIGAEVLLRYPAFPHQHYGQYRGRVMRIARQPIATTSSTRGDADAEARPVAYRVTVALERQRVRDDHGKERELQPGLGVQAEVVVEKRRLYEWLLEPFARFRERFHA